MRLEVARGELTVVLARRDLISLLARAAAPCVENTLVGREIWVDETPAAGSFRVRSEPDDLHFLGRPTPPTAHPHREENP